MINVDGIKSKIAELNEIDSQRRVFASRSHQYKYNPCLQEEDIIVFEKTHEIELPHDYKEFLLKVGNGGAGPGYGVLPLHKFYYIGEWARYMCDTYFGGSFELKEEDPKFLSKPFPHTIKWGDDTNEESDEECKLSREDYIKQFNYDIQGSITLCSHGCGLHDILIVSGPQRGKVWYEFRNEYQGMGPVADSFTEWYENWLDESIKETKEFWDKRDMMVGTVKKISASGYGREITVILIHNKKRITFDFSQTDEFIEKGEKSQKIKLNDIIYFSLYIDNVVPVKTDRKCSFLRKGWSTQFLITSYVQRIVDNNSFLCNIDGFGKSILVITPNEVRLQVGDKFMVKGTIESDLYKVERNTILGKIESTFGKLKRSL